MKKHKFKEGDILYVFQDTTDHLLAGDTVEVITASETTGGEPYYEVKLIGASDDDWAGVPESDCRLVKIQEPEMSEVDKAKKVLEDAGYLGVYWQRMDVWGRANELGIELTDGQLDGVCETIVRRHDAEQGINWDVIDCRLQEYAADEDENERVQAMWDEGYAQVMGDKE